MKGQGKTWVARQFVLDKQVQAQLPSGVLLKKRPSRAPVDWANQTGSFAGAVREIRFLSVQPNAADWNAVHTSRYTWSNGLQYIGCTNRQAIVVARSVQLLVVRRDQLKAAVTSRLFLQARASYACQ